MNPTPKPLVTRFEQEIRTLYSENRMGAKDIAQLIRNRHGLAESQLTTNMVKGKLAYDIKKGYVSKNPVSIGGTSVLARPGPAGGADCTCEVFTRSLVTHTHTSQGEPNSRPSHRSAIRTSNLQ